MEQTEEFGLRPSGTAGKTTNETAHNTATPTAADDPAVVVAGGAGEVMAYEAAGDDALEVTKDDSLEMMAGDVGDDGAGDVAEAAEPGISGGRRDEMSEQRPATGEPRVDAALARLAELEGLPVTEHRAVFEDVHRRLRDVLGELDTGQPRAGGTPGAQRAGQAADNPW